MISVFAALTGLSITVHTLRRLFLVQKYSVIARLRLALDCLISEKVLMNDGRL